MRWIEPIAATMMLLLLVMTIPQTARGEDAPPCCFMLDLIATAGMTPGDSVEVYWLLNGRNGSPTSIRDARVGWTYQFVNVEDSSCVQSIRVNTTAHPGLNILRVASTISENAIEINAFGGRDTVKLDPCFDGTNRIALAFAPEERPSRTDADVVVAGGFITGPGGETRAPINYGDFDGATVMYLDVTEDAN